jgi:uncharacterized protein (DUF1697 family)
MAATRTYAALLRGVNVGGKRALPMAELRTLCLELGHTAVSSYLQSGNLVLASSADPKAIAAGIRGAIAERFGLDVAVLLRTHPQLAAIAAGCPFAADEPAKLHVLFLDDRPKAAALATLDPDRSSGDQFHAAGRELYLHVPNGSGRTRLTLDYFERRLGVTGTARNWNTVLRLVELTAP